MNSNVKIRSLFTICREEIIVYSLAIGCGSDIVLSRVVLLRIVLSRKHLYTHHMFALHIECDALKEDARIQHMHWQYLSAFIFFPFYLFHSDENDDGRCTSALATHVWTQFIVTYTQSSYQHPCIARVHFTVSSYRNTYTYIQKRSRRKTLSVFRVCRRVQWILCS